ncbi:LrgB family protein [Peptoniphilus equinus]|uniref:LrgB family protein n=1 Tax=Peptoniphilus equinus TaxID=3016343 RepID=A0ABY7QSZ0_9FIRM|nr:LrgB family protein [Peptoniphilus equinus]WBW49586.1 LrgB family protein [Peptoniphilus equinus]
MRPFIDTVYFGILLSCGAYLLGLGIAKRVRSPLVNPLLLGIAFTILALVVLDVDFDTYNNGAKYISFLVAPATVSLMVELYKNLSVLKKDVVPILVGIVVGSVTALASTVILAKAFGLSELLTTSVLPHSVTTAIAMPLSEQYQGNGTLAVIAVMVTGITGAVLGPVLLKALKITHPVAKGVAIGTASHAVGTSKAQEMGEVEGAMSGLSIAIAGLVTVVVMPLVMIVVHWLG